jgi:hypothetical protein
MKHLNETTAAPDGTRDTARRFASINMESHAIDLQLCVISLRRARNRLTWFKGMFNPVAEQGWRVRFFDGAL